MATSTVRVTPKAAVDMVAPCVGTEVLITEGRLSGDMVCRTFPTPRRGTILGIDPVASVDDEGVVDTWVYVELTEPDDPIDGLLAEEGLVYIDGPTQSGGIWTWDAPLPPTPSAGACTNGRCGRVKSLIEARVAVTRVLDQLRGVAAPEILVDLEHAVESINAVRVEVAPDHPPPLGARIRLTEPQIDDDDGDERTTAAGAVGTVVRHGLQKVPGGLPPHIFFEATFINGASLVFHPGDQRCWAQVLAKEVQA